jgi:hypothetical protein
MLTTNRALRRPLRSTSQRSDVKWRGWLSNSRTPTRTPALLPDDHWILCDTGSNSTKHLGLVGSAWKRRIHVHPACHRHCVCRRAAFGALGSGLDVARTVAQSDYLQTATQARCARPNLDVPVALLFTPVKSAPGQLHFVMPGKGQPYIKGTQYGDR